MKNPIFLKNNLTIISFQLTAYAQEWASKLPNTCEFEHRPTQWVAPISVAKQRLC